MVDFVRRKERIGDAERGLIVQLHSDGIRCCRRELRSRGRGISICVFSTLIPREVKFGLLRVGKKAGSQEW